MTSKAPYFGKIRLFWCPTCRATLLENRCRNCGNKLRPVKLAPPGDVRPAFNEDWNLVLMLVEDVFGTSAKKSLKAFDNSLILLNKAPHEDRLDEIIINGKSVGVLSYDIKEEKFRFIPKPELAEILIKGECSNIIHLKPGTATFLKKKSSILFPGIEKLDSRIKLDQTVIILENRKVIATGVSKIDGTEFDSHSKGIAARVKYLATQDTPTLFPEKIDDFIRNNRAHILDFQKEAVEFIRNTVMKNKKKPILSYSGGKDSLVTGHLVSLALDEKFDMIFINTGFEFPETIKNVTKFAEHILKGDMTRFHTKKADDQYFWEIFSRYGPPARDARYCCKKSKLGPVSQLLKEQIS
ncbi:MAG: phosphoadenosine phosphosulfate reductase domain-containing protein [Candidatus Hodarchaeales archaeon]